MLEKLGIWLFSMEERSPVSYIGVFFMIIIISTAISLFIVAVDNHVVDQVEYLWDE